MPGHHGLSFRYLCLCVCLQLVHPIQRLMQYPLADLTIRALLRTRRQFSHVLSNSASGLNMSRYFRLMALSTTLALFTLSFTLFVAISSLRLVPLKPWISWASAHQNIGQVNFIPHEAMIARPLQNFNNNMCNWITPGGAFLFFGFFGFSGEACQDYSQIFWRIVRPLGIKPPALTPRITSWYAYLAILHGRTPTLTNPLVKAQERPF
jgi:hypothetical protein